MGLWNRVSLSHIGALLALCAPLAFGQTITTGDLSGVVTDSSGAVVPKAAITLRYVDTNEVRTETSDSSGKYRFSLLKPGDYTLSAHTSGLKSNIERLTLLVGQEQQMNLLLSVQGTQQVIEVTAATEIVQTENANLTTSFSTQQVQDLPMAGGDLTTLAMTVPGVRVNVKGGSGNMNANGVPGSSILFTLNGFDVMDPYNNLNNSGASNNLLGANEISEAAVVLNAFSAQYGRMAGGQENLIGKSGTNGFHGNLVYNYNSQIFNAKDFFVNSTGAPKTRSDANQYAAGGGGPIKKNKLFFFVDTEGLRYVLPSNTAAAFPSPQLEQYALAHASASAVPLYQAAFNLYDSAPGINRAVPMTNGSGVLQDSSGKLGCQSRGTFSGTQFAPGQTFGVNVPCAVALITSNNQLNTESLFIARVDYNITSRQKINFRYEYDWGVQATFTSPISPIFSSISSQPQHVGTLNYTYVITPGLVNNFIGGASWYTAIFGVPDFTKALSVLPERITFGDGGGNPGFANAGASSPSGFPNGRNVGQLQLIDDLSWNKGRHTISTGVNYRYNKVTATNLSSGTVQGLYTFNDLTDFATGIVNMTGKGSSFGQTFSVLGAAHIRASSLNLYAQDEWSVRGNLKVTYGIRFERDGNPTCVDNCFNRMTQQFGTSGYQGGLNTPYNQTIATGLHSAYAGLEAVIPEPRFGFVYSPFGSGAHKPVLRGGIGLFANLFAVSVANSIDTNSPGVFSPSVPFGTVGLASDPNSSLAAAQQSFNAFENGFKQGFTLAQIQAALGNIKFTLPNYYSPPQNFAAPKILQWNFEIEEPLSSHNVLAVTYTGNHGYDEQVTNILANGFIASNSIYAKTGYAGLPLAAPDPRFLQISQVLTSGYSNYDALIVQLRHSFSLGFQGQIGYTWSHALGILANGSGYLWNPFNLRDNYGPLNFDTRHMLTADFIWNSPWKFESRALNLIAGGWTVGGKFFVYSGPPVSVYDSAINAQINSAGGLGSSNILADLTDPSIFNRSCTSANVSGNTPCFTASQFAARTAQNDLGNIAPNSFRGPGYFDIDTQVTKNFKIRERATLGLGAQFFNILNHPNFGNPGTSVTSSSLGFSTGTVVPPTSIYGSFQSGTVSGRVVVMVGKFTF